MRKKIKWLKGKVDDISESIKEKLDDLDSYLFQVEDRVKILFPEGFEDDISELFKKDSKKYVKSGDEGCGLPGSIEWHTASINGLETRQDVAVYVKDLTGDVVAPTGRMDYLKKRAIKLVEGFLNDNNK
jgi:hypothetical protein